MEFRAGKTSDAVAAFDLPVFSHYAYGSAASGTSYVAGFYVAPAADANLSNASPTVTIGAADVPYAAHDFCVAGGAGTTDGSDLVLTASGTSITDAGVRTPADSEVLVADCTAASADEYFEGKKWLGQVTLTLTSTGGTTFSFDFNYGLCKYEDFGNRNFIIDNFEVVGLAGANDASFDIELLHHKATGWTYHATAFVPGSTALYKMSTDHSTENSLDNAVPFAWKRTGLSQAVAGSAAEGALFRITNGGVNSVDYATFDLGVIL